MLDKINNPSDIKKLSFDELNQLANEIRNTLIKNTKKTGGHLGSNLGTVELTIAMHFVFNTPEDSFIWDVGHQAYAHKMLTGRNKSMSTLRKLNGISGFTKIAESAVSYYTSDAADEEDSVDLGGRGIVKIKN